MKILLVNKYFNMHGGSETYFFGLAELLRQAGHEVIFFAMQDEKNLPCEQSAYFVSNVEFNGELTATQKLKAAFRMVYSFEAKKKISALIEKEKPDIIHINLFHRVLTASIVDAAKKHGIPVVLTMHDLNCVLPESCHARPRENLRSVPARELLELCQACVLQGFAGEVPDGRHRERFQQAQWAVQEN